MNEKRHYEAPSIKVLWMDTRNSLLAGSGSVLETASDSFDEDATLNDFDDKWE